MALEDTLLFYDGQFICRRSLDSARQTQFIPGYDGVCCNHCGAWGPVATQTLHTDCKGACVNCGAWEEQHPAGNCLFKPTRFKAFDFDWKVTR